MGDKQVNAKLDEAVLALLFPGIIEHRPIGGARTRKSFDRSAMERPDTEVADLPPSAQGQLPTMPARARALNRRRLRFPGGPIANADKRILGQTRT